MLDSAVESGDAGSSVRLFKEILVPAVLAYLTLIVLGIVFGVIAGVQGRTPAETQIHVQTLLGSFNGVQISSLVLYGAFYVFAEWRATAAGRAPLRTLYQPLRWSQAAKCAGAGIGGALILLTAIVLWTKLTATPLAPVPAEAGLMPVSRGVSGSDKLLRTALSMVTIGLVGPIVEEILFRGLLQRWLAEKMPGMRAVWASAAIFSLCHFKLALHFNSWGVLLSLGIGCLGVATGFLSHRCRSLSPGFILHASYNMSLLAVNLMGHG